MLLILRDPFLYTGIILAILNLFGTIPVVKEALNRISRGLDNAPFNNLRTYNGILKGPTDLDKFKFAISISISPAVTGEIKKLLRK